MKRQTLSVKQMQKLLETQRNRSLSNRWLGLYQQMVAGKWNPDIAPIIMFDDGTLADGQHRLRAAVELAEPFVCWVTTITAPDITKVDAGRPRRTHDYCAILGLPFSTTHIAAARSLRWLLDGDWPNTRAVINDDLIELCEIYKLVEFPKICRSLRGGPQLLAAWAFIRSSVGDEANAFFESVNSGVALSEGSPGIALRRRLLTYMQLEGSNKQAECLWLVIRAWNMNVRGEVAWRLTLPKRRTPILPIVSAEPSTLDAFREVA